jgi:glycosyltransferase involved in cell wall biosynthesis
MQPFFSIIVPTYNAEILLPFAIRSLTSQDFADFEVLILDGLSDDNTLAIAQQLATNDSRIKVYCEKDDGIYDAMNKGILKSKGQYLYFLGSDDTIFKNTVLSCVHQSLLNYPVDVLYGDVYMTKFRRLYAGEFTKEKLFYHNICHQSIFLKKSVFTRTGLFNVKYVVLADYDNNIKWFLSNKISSRYDSIIVANYAHGGFSSQNGDDVFNKSKKWLFLRRASWLMPLSFYKKMIKNSFKLKYQRYVLGGRGTSEF